MQITASAVSLDVADVPASVAFPEGELARLFQVTGPHGVIVQLLDRNAPVSR